MGRDTSIEWTDATWNCLRGCSRVSEGCRHCYAEGVAYRFSGPGNPYEGLVRIGSDGERRREWNGQIQFVEKHVLDPLKWKPVLTGIRGGDGELRQRLHKDRTVTVTRERSRRIFVNSMSDLFHENTRWEWINKIFAVMAMSPQSTFQILTKRPEVMAQYIHSIGNAARDGKWFLQSAADEIVDNCASLEDHPWPLPNVQLGVSCEDQKAAEDRIPLLLETPAAVRFISAEPLLGPLDLFAFLKGDIRDRILVALNSPPMPGLGWIIAGGESGRGARPMHPDWARSLRDQCQAAGVPFFFKQHGEWQHRACVEDTRLDPPTSLEYFPELGATFCRMGKKAAGAMLDGREWREFPKAKERA
jgi:protein gp37